MHKYFDKKHAPKELARHWYLERKPMPDVPFMHGCPMPGGFRRGADRSARILLAYFHPWTLASSCVVEHVPHVRDLGQRNTWAMRCNEWLQGGILTEEMRRIVTNFASVTSLRPQEGAAGESEEEVSDRELALSLIHL